VCTKVRLEDLYLVWLIGANILEETAASFSGEPCFISFPLVNILDRNLHWL